MIVDLPIIVASAAMLILAHLLWKRSHKRSAKAFLYLRRANSGRVVSHAIVKDLFRIGRHTDNDLQIANNTISRYHAEIIGHRNGSFSIRDLDSKNGVRVGSRRVDSSLLKDGDTIQIGSIRMKFARRAQDYNTYEDTIMTEEYTPTRFADKRRRMTRNPVAIGGVRLYNEDVGWISGRVSDLSEEGAFIVANRSIEPGSPVDVILPVLNDDRPPRWLRIVGEVVRKTDKGVGVAFYEINHDTREVLKSAMVDPNLEVDTRAVASPSEETRLVPPKETLH